MPPLPKPASYPVDLYSVAHFWQFSETGGIKPNAIICSGQPEFRQMDLSWVPLSGMEFRTLFGVASP
jgi:hypothetical protein